eukprot:3142420-Ditylum_brightwellii.AAC.1
MEVEAIFPRYQSAKDVDLELDNILDNLDSTMLNVDAHKTLGSLQFPRCKLYGRDDHLSTLMNACLEIGTSGGSKMILVSGYSGVGKSAIVEY